LAFSRRKALLTYEAARQTACLTANERFAPAFCNVTVSLRDERGAARLTSKAAVV